MTNEQHQVLVMRTAVLRTNNKIVTDFGRTARNGLTVILRPHMRSDQGRVEGKIAEGQTFRA